MGAVTSASLAGLFPASFNGVGFFVKDDGAATGRRLRPSQYPGVDDPYIEDLGRALRNVEVSGYVVGDDCEIAMHALEAACETPGAGALTLPSQGMVLARCARIKRRRDLKDRKSVV